MNFRNFLIASLVLIPLVGCEPEPTALEKCKERINDRTDRCYFDARERGDIVGIENCRAEQRYEHRYCERKHGK